MGDEVLKIVAQIIREKCRPYDCIGRWTGDEFVIALPGVIGAGRGKDRGTNHQNHRTRPTSRIRTTWSKWA